MITGGNTDLQTAYVLNLSEGGLFFTLRNDQSQLIKKGDFLRFVEIKKWRTIQFLVNIHADVVWCGNIPEQSIIGIGCQFKEISERNRKNIKDLVGERISQGMELP
ncbi:MAG: PilZ domain-containing protein [Calditrichaceae bacterium]